MRKFYKILTLVLVLMAILTAVTVVALAEEPDQPYEVIYGNYATFDTYEDGVYLCYGRTAQAIVTSQENGNKYVLMKDVAENTVTNPQWDITFSNTQAGTKYNVVDYPYFMVEFDIMTLSGSYSGHSYYSRFYTDTTPGSFVASTKFTEIGLSTTPYDWQHLTILVQYKDDGKFSQHAYINGEYISSVDVDLSTNASFKNSENKVIVKSMKMYPSTGSEVGVDNMRFTYFPAGYLGDNINLIANVNFNNGDGYEFPYKFTVAKVGDTVYDNANEAIAAAPENGTVKLTYNANETLVIDKNILLDTNVYDADGNPTGEFYTYEYKTSKGLVPTETEEGSGIFSFARSANAIDIIWDEPCAEDCDCFSEYGGHIMTATTVALLGSTPEYVGIIPSWEVLNDYSHKRFAGWSYTNDGTVDELLPITESDLSVGTIKLYPVYETVIYSLEVTSSVGIEYYLEEEFGDILTTLPNGSTIKLLSDVYTEVPKVEIKKSLTIDLNGHNLKRCFVYGNVYEATKDGDTLVYGTDSLLEEVASDGDIFFRPMATDVNITFTSSTGSGTLYNFKMQADTWTYNNEVVKRTSKSITPARLTYAYEGTFSASNFQLNLNGGITIYAGQAFYSLYASGTGYAINIDNVTYYKMDSEAFIYARTNRKIDISISNSLFYAPGQSGSFFFLGTSGYTPNAENYSEILIKNCDIIKANTTYGFDISNTRPDGTTKLIYDNCRMYDSYTTHADVMGINGVLGYYTDESSKWSSIVNAAEGYTVEDTSIQFTYYVPKSTFAADTTNAVNLPTFDYPATTKHTITYNKIITKPVTVNWIGGDGTTVEHTEQLLPGIDALNPPRISPLELPEDPYRNIAYQWADSNVNGKAITEILGTDGKSFTWQDSYSFYAVDSLDGVTNYIGGIKDVYVNMSYYSNFRYNLYLPVDPNLEITSVSWTQSTIVKIDGKNYYSYIYDCSTTGAADNAEIVITFNANGESYTQNSAINAIKYAEILLNSPENDIESTAIASMVRYIKEARTVAGLETGDIYDELIAVGNLEDYKEKTEYDDLDVNYSGLAGTSLSFALDGTSAAYIIKLPEENFPNAENATVTVKYTDGTELTVKKSETANTWYTNGTKIYDIVENAIVITITIPTEEGSTVLEGTYSVGAYIQAMDNDLAKSMYEFGVAAKAYREYIKTL